MVNTTTLLEGVKSNIKSYLTSTWTYGAVGGNTTGSSATESTVSDPGLESELLRKAWSATTTAENTVTFQLTILTSEANGYYLNEVGGFDASSGGNMGFREIFSPLLKDSSTEVRIEIEEEITVSQ
jgi:hypothetical protein